MRAHRKFFLLRPQQLPRSRAELVATISVRAALSTLRRSAPPTSDEAALELAKQALLRLDLPDQCCAPVTEDSDESPDNRANDEVFDIVRVAGESVPLLVHSTIRGFIALLEEALDAGANVTPAEWRQLRTAFAV